MGGYTTEVSMSGNNKNICRIPKKTWKRKAEKCDLLEIFEDI